MYPEWMEKSASALALLVEQLFAMRTTLCNANNNWDLLQSCVFSLSASMAGEPIGIAASFTL